MDEGRLISIWKGLVLRVDVSPGPVSLRNTKEVQKGVAEEVWHFCNLTAKE